MTLINREHYINQLKEYKDTRQIKVITGMRRCGKSSLLKLFINELKKEGINQENIIYINFERLETAKLRDYLALYDYIKGKIKDNGKHYLFLDEIQLVSKWEEVVNSLKVNYESNIDIYITGSNAYLLSSELSTMLSGRYIEINMLPLSFKEYLLFDGQYRPNQNKTIEEKFEEYLKYGSLPVLFDYKESESYFNTVLEGIFNTVIIKDVIQRNNIKNTVLLENVSLFTLDNIGNMVSPKNISKYLKNDNIKTTPNTIQEYLKALENAYLFYLVKRYDVKGKMYLKTLRKCYAVDMGLRNAMLGFRNIDRGHILENIIYLELKRRGYDIAVGKVGSFEVDFIVSNQDTRKYYQVAETIGDRGVLERECKSLESIKDNYEKVILSMDKTFVKDANGIKFQNIIDFLLE